MATKDTLSHLETLRKSFEPVVPLVLQDLSSLVHVYAKSKEKSSPQFDIEFPHLSKIPDIVHFKLSQHVKHSPLRVGVVFSGGPAPGGHNVISGLFDALKKMHTDSVLIGFKNGPKGILDNEYLEIRKDHLSNYRNQGGFDLLGSGREKIETEEKLAKALKSVESLKLDGLVIIGGDDSNTNAAFLAEYFLEHECKTTVVGVPKTIDGDLRSEEIELPFGFDTATKIYSETIGNLAFDALSSKKMYFFVRLMGRNASHITLECALKTRANLSLIGEEIAREKMKLAHVVKEICDLIQERAKLGKHYGVILIPEGLIEFFLEFKNLILELNRFLVPGSKELEKLQSLTLFKEKIDYIISLLTPDSKACYSDLPETIQMQLIEDRDAHGNVQVSKIETEKLIIEMCKRELKFRKYSGNFSPQSYFLGYEGRSGMPSNFDANYCYSLGMTAALLIFQKATGFIAFVQNLKANPESWKIGGRNLKSMMTYEKRFGKEKPVIAKTLVNLQSPLFQTFKKEQERWKIEDCYVNPGPIQYFGPNEMTDSIPLSL